VWGWTHYLHQSDFLNFSELFSIVGFPWLRHVTILADVTMGTKARILLQEKKRHEGSDVSMETRVRNLL
jgi:hypothetical protein